MNKIQKDFSKAAECYDDYAYLQKEIGVRLLSRLDVLNIEPQTILDLGCGTGAILAQLKIKYPKAQVVGLDLSLAMAQQAQSKSNVVCADMHHLPFKSNSIDLVVSNFTLQWSDDLTAVFMEVQRVVRPEALFLFATVGAASLPELRESWATVDDKQRVRDFADMHTIGDALYQSSWQEPVMDIDRVTNYYKDVRAVLNEFKQLGVTNKEKNRAQGLTGKKAFAQFVENYEAKRQEQGIPLSWEVVYGYGRKASGIRFEGNSG